MQVVDTLTMLKMAVGQMPKAKTFYADKLGLKVMTGYRRDDHNWWVTLAFPEGGTSLTLTTAQENMKPSTMNLYFSTSDVAAAPPLPRDLPSKRRSRSDRLRRSLSSIPMQPDVHTNSFSALALLLLSVRSVDFRRLRFSVLRLALFRWS